MVNTNWWFKDILHHQLKVIYLQARVGVTNKFKSNVAGLEINVDLWLMI